jgi:undecaprenyl-diphosphatase
MLLMVGGAYVFIQIIDEVREGEYQHFDDWLLQSLRKKDNPAQPVGPSWLPEVGRDATALGGVLCIMLVTAFVAIFLLLEGKRHAAGFLVIAVGGGAIVSGVLKHLVARDRPDIVPHLSDVYTSSFPSGHSMLSAVAYLTLGSLLARITPRRRTRLFLLFAAVSLTVIVGLSRVYMGVHYPTDVLGGWAAGLTWALVCWIVATLLQRKGAIERENEGMQQEGAL